jgi:predicted RNA-binding protein YlqC (UPF0109 family)
MSSTIDQQFIEYIVKSLVSKPDAVVIDRRVDEKGVLLELHVDPEDLGRVIGKRGATAQSLRTLLRALGTKQDARLNLKIIDPNQPERDYNSGPAPTHDRDDYQPRDDQPMSNQPVSDDKPADNPATATTTVPEEPVAEPAAEPVTETTPAPVPEVEDTSHSDRMTQARKELAEFDDLDV